SRLSPIPSAPDRQQCQPGGDGRPRLHDAPGAGETQQTWTDWARDQPAGDPNSHRSTTSNSCAFVFRGTPQRHGRQVHFAPHTTSGRTVVSSKLPPPASFGLPRGATTMRDPPGTAAGFGRGAQPTRCDRLEGARLHVRSLLASAQGPGLLPAAPGQQESARELRLDGSGGLRRSRPPGVGRLSGGCRALGPDAGPGWPIGEAPLISLGLSSEGRGREASRRHVFSYARDSCGFFLVCPKGMYVKCKAFVGDMVRVWDHYYEEREPYGRGNFCRLLDKVENDDSILCGIELQEIRLEQQTQVRGGPFGSVVDEVKLIAQPSTGGMEMVRELRDHSLKAKRKVH
ncbi:Pentatricopeptide repeat-containing protein, partial [Durusdinium trenchii]